jgi:hypothetical protein
MAPLSLLISRTKATVTPGLLTSNFDLLDKNMQTTTPKVILQLSQVPSSDQRQR